MASGLLEVNGTINLNQFWPEGSSDANKTKIIVDLAPNQFRFRPYQGKAFQTTNAFDKAVVKGFAEADKRLGIK